ncbi:hypothetical protein EV677_1179 [Herminiimonas fonticola]|uniref:Uncharacterized protein n=1 Tax=Herminiimonas fonticola TaxID=303380 RepID=A0A4R6GIF5_9BURK|nr:hypothetical protein Hfont_1147 [Herminiimonas fonticola]TDN94627.1 hypothetical protein EV677_1179 [Herminiimonas fonticola]
MLLLATDDAVGKGEAGCLNRASLYEDGNQPRLIALRK